MSPIFQGDRRDTVVSLFCLVKDERKRDTPPCVPLVCLMSISPVRFSVKDLSVEGKSSAGFHPLHIVAGEISPPWFPGIVLLCRCLSDGNIIRKETHLWCWHYSGRRFVI